MVTFNKTYSGLIRWSFEMPNAAKCHFTVSKYDFAVSKCYSAVRKYRFAMGKCHLDVRKCHFSMGKCDFVAGKMEGFKKLF